MNRPLFKLLWRALLLGCLARNVVAGCPWRELRTGKETEAARPSQEGNEPEWVIRVRTGYMADKELTTVHPDDDGVFRLELKELDRIEVHLPKVAHALLYEGFHVVGKDMRPLPIGSSLDEEKGIFYWSLGTGFLGDFHFLFRLRSPARWKEIRVSIKVLPKFAAQPKQKMLPRPL